MVDIVAESMKSPIVLQWKKRLALFPILYLPYSQQPPILDLHFLDLKKRASPLVSLSTGITGIKNIVPETTSSIVMAAGGQKIVGFLSLPREVRDAIYHNLVVARDPIQYDQSFRSLSRSGKLAETAMTCMFNTMSNTQIAQETRESFYQHNTFLIHTHDIPALLESKNHVMSFGPGVGIEPTFHSTPFEAAAWVRNLAVRVGWHTSGGWLTNVCCLRPAQDLQLLLEWDSLRSVIIDARFGAWSFGYPQGFGWDLLKEMNTKWGKIFRIYNDQRLEDDTRRYTSNRRDVSDVLLSRNWNEPDLNEVETASESSEHKEANRREEAELSSEDETAAEDEEEEGEEDNEEDNEEVDME